MTTPQYLQISSDTGPYILPSGTHENLSFAILLPFVCVTRTAMNRDER